MKDLDTDQTPLEASALWFRLGLPKPVLCLLLVFTSISLTSCYTLSQGAHQARLLFKREDLKTVVAQQDETEERLEKLRIIPEVLRFSETELGLTPGKSYQTYVRLPKGQPLTWVVQAAEKRTLTRKTWWFPVVGEQPYLGFFKKDDGVAFQESLKADGLDTRLGGVDAFSMLGFLADPVYSSMIDGRTLVEVVDLIIHETVHRTLYVPGASAFNESFADFVAKQGALKFFEKASPTLQVAAGDVSGHLQQAKRELAAGRHFKVFLDDARRLLEERYASALEDPKLQSMEAFLAYRSKIFEELQASYDQRVLPHAIGTWYERAFRASSMNNAVFLGYSLYEANPEPFDSAFALANGDVKGMVSNLRACIERADFSEGKKDSEIWPIVARCGGKDQ